MPLYEYQCRACQAEAELLVHGSSEPACPSCGSTKLTKLLSVVAAPSSREASAETASGGPKGSCGPSCGCHPHG